MIAKAAPLVIACGLMACGTLLGINADDPVSVDGGAAGDGNVFVTDGASSSGDSPGSEASVPFSPSRIDSTSVKLDGPELSDVSDIDTGALLIKLSTAAAGVPVSYFFGDPKSGAAVLVVATWHVNVDVVVHGSRPLVVVAAADVNVDASIKGSAKGGTPGPGGAAPGVGAGKGADGALGSSNEKSGGGGAGFGTTGAQGQNLQSVQGGKGGGTYGATFTDFFAAAGGGKGYSVNCGQRPGGAGGGAVQISARGAIRVGAAGSISVGGGGGDGGCLGGSAGGGGGSGGSILLEAVTEIAVDAAGVLAANGGGGGSGGGIPSANGGDGNGGKDGQATGKPAPGGADEGTCTPCSGGAGGAGATAPQHPGPNATTNAGGGGGAVGRIWLRTRSTPAVMTGTISPPAILDSTF